jgi:tripartite-type tricarboxylate transporter receptor subunit TctC
MQWECRSRLTTAFLTAIFFVFAGATASSQTAGTIRLILPFPPGGPADVMARVVAERIGATGGPTLVIESHPGAGTEIGTEYVARSAPDGSTLGIISNSFVVLPLTRKLKYDPFTDLVPICELATFPPLIVVNSDSPYHTLADLIDAAHAQPGVLTLATIGPATSSQMAFEMLKHAAKANITFVPFAGYTLAIQALLGNQVTAALADLASLQGQIQTGKLRALATTARKRITSLTDVPTVAELGYNVQDEFFGGVIAPAKTPKETIAKLTEIFSTALRSPEIKAKYANYGFLPGGECGADYAAILRKDYANYGQIIKDANIKME